MKREPYRVHEVKDFDGTTPDTIYSEPIEKGETVEALTIHAYSDEDQGADAEITVGIENGKIKDQFKGKENAAADEGLSLESSVIAIAGEKFYAEFDAATDGKRGHLVISGWKYKHK